MTMISLHGKRLAKKKRRSVIDHLAGLGFTNRLALYIIAFLAAAFILPERVFKPVIPAR